MLPEQFMSVLHYPSCMPSSFPPFAEYAKDGVPGLLSFTSWAATPAAQDLRGGSTQRAGRSVHRYVR